MMAARGLCQRPHRGTPCVMRGMGTGGVGPTSEYTNVVREGQSRTKAQTRLDTCNMRTHASRAAQATHHNQSSPCRLTRVSAVAPNSIASKHHTQAVHHAHAHLDWLHCHVANVARHKRQHGIGSINTHTQPPLAFQSPAKNAWAPGWVGGCAVHLRSYCVTHSVITVWL